MAFKRISLTVQSAGNERYRLGINTLDSRTLFKCRGKIVILELSKTLTIKCKTSCGALCDANGDWLLVNPKTNKPYRKKGYDLYDKELNSWIVKNQFHNYKSRNPPRLSFQLTTDEESIYLKYIKNAHNTQ